MRLLLLFVVCAAGSFTSAAPLPPRFLPGGSRYDGFLFKPGETVLLVDWHTRPDGRYVPMPPLEAIVIEQSHRGVVNNGNWYRVKYRWDKEVVGNRQEWQLKRKP